MKISIKIIGICLISISLLLDANSDDCWNSGQTCTCSNTSKQGICSQGHHKEGLYCQCDTSDNCKTRDQTCTCSNTNDTGVCGVGPAKEGLHCQCDIGNDNCRLTNQLCVCSNTNDKGRCNFGHNKEGLYCQCPGRDDCIKNEQTCICSNTGLLGKCKKDFRDRFSCECGYDRDNRYHSPITPEFYKDLLLRDDENTMTIKKGFEQCGYYDGDDNYHFPPITPESYLRAVLLGEISIKDFERSNLNRKVEALALAEQSNYYREGFDASNPFWSLIKQSFHMGLAIPLKTMRLLIPQYISWSLAETEWNRFSLPNMLTQFTKTLPYDFIALFSLWAYKKYHRYLAYTQTNHYRLRLATYYLEQRYDPHHLDGLKDIILDYVGGDMA